jgi:DNA-binding transcriptional LysR family regulator
LGSNEAIKESVAGGLGVGVVSRHVLHGQQKEHGVSIVDVQGFPLPSAWHIVHPVAKKLSPLAQAFKQHLIREIGRRKSGSKSVS